MIKIIVYLFFVFASVDVSAQDKNMLDSLIWQSLNCFFHRFDNSKNELARNAYSTRVKYVCKEGLPLDFTNGSSVNIFFTIMIIIQ